MKPAPPTPTPRGRRLFRSPRQTELFPGFRSKRPISEEALSLIPDPGQAGVIDRQVKQLTKQFQQSMPKDIGLTRTRTGKPVERMLTPEDLAQEVYQVTRARQLGLSPKRARSAADPVLLQRLQRRFPQLTPAQLDRYLYPKTRKAVTAQVRGLTRPTALPEAERRILAMEQRIRDARARDPRFALLDPDPGTVFRRLARDPGFAKQLRREGVTRFFRDEHGVEQTLAKGLPSSAREVASVRGEPMFPVGTAKPGQPTTTRLAAETASPLDELLAKEADSVKEKLSGPAARLELALRALTTKQREVVTRVMGLGRPAEGFREVARDLKVDHSTIREHYRAGMKKLEAATKVSRRPATPAPAAPAASAPAAPKTIEERARELVAQRLAEANRRIENRRRWEYIAPIRRMREQPPTRTYATRSVPGGAYVSSDELKALKSLGAKQWPPTVHRVFKKWVRMYPQPRN